MAVLLERVILKKHNLQKQHKCPSTDGWINKSNIFMHDVLFGYKQE